MEVQTFCLCFHSAIDTPMYEIRGTAFYKTNDGGCEPEIINAVQKLLPRFMRTVMCAETTAFGSYRYACNFYIETITCNQEKVIYYINILRFILIQFFFFTVYSVNENLVEINISNIIISRLKNINGICRERR